MQIPSLMEGGTAWFTDLTVSDTTMILPFMAFGVFLLSAELGGADGMQGQPPHVIQRFKWAMRILTAVMVPFAKDLPAVRSWCTLHAFVACGALHCPSSHICHPEAQCMGLRYCYPTVQRATFTLQPSRMTVNNTSSRKCAGRLHCKHK